jgi:hypothetical protein
VHVRVALSVKNVKRMSFCAGCGCACSRWCGGMCGCNQAQQQGGASVPARATAATGYERTGRDGLNLQASRSSACAVPSMCNAASDQLNCCVTAAAAGCATSRYYGCCLLLQPATRLVFAVTTRSSNPAACCSSHLQGRARQGQTESQHRHSGTSCMRAAAHQRG